jgi:putative copper resistance protein D
MNNLNQQDMAKITAGIPFPVVTQGATEIARSYSLFRRTIANPDLMGEGTVPKHMEFLLDRYGYMRARWIPAVDGTGWTDIGLLTQQIDQLNQEKEILPPPADYVHDGASDMPMGDMPMGNMPMGDKPMGDMPKGSGDMPMGDMPKGSP